MPSPSALRTFEAAARLGSFKAAAGELSVTPTAVSHQIRALEEHLETPLFIRRTRAVELTESGQRLAEAAHQAFRQIMQALEDVSAAETVLTVGTTPAFAALWLVPRLGQFQEHNPEFRIQLDTGTAPIDLERDRRVDVVIRYAAGDYPRLHAVPLFDETFGAYATPDYLRALTRWDDAVLIETAWQQPGMDSPSWQEWHSEAKIVENTPPNPRRFDQEHYVVHAALASQGIALASSLLANDFVERGWLEAYRPEVRLAGRGYTSLCVPARASTRKVACFIDWLLEAAAERP